MDDENLFESLSRNAKFGMSKLRYVNDGYFMALWTRKWRKKKLKNETKKKKRKKFEDYKQKKNEIKQKQLKAKKRWKLKKKQQKNEAEKNR